MFSVGKKGKMAFFLIMMVGVAGGGFYAYMYYSPLENASIHVDFADSAQYYNLDAAGNSNSQKVTPVYNTLNIWDLTWFSDPNNDPLVYCHKWYFVDQLVVMTATGGRSTGSNEFLSISPEGLWCYNFTKLDAMLDWFQISNLTPIFVVGNTPKVFTPDPNNVNGGAFDADVATPINFTAYYQYIQDLTQHILDYTSSDFLENWTWRIYTEPDNEDWLTGALDSYFQIYNTSCIAIRSVLPHARLELGNMMLHPLEDFHKDFLQKVHQEIPEIFPEVVGWSLYGFAEKDLFLRDEFVYFQDWKIFIHSLGYDDIEYVFEEGQILVDDYGERLWGGDSTEMGAAFMANIYTECILQNYSRFTAWDFYASEVRTPKLNVIDMFRKMLGEDVWNIDIAYDWNILEEQQSIMGFASMSASQDSAHLLYYNLDNNRDLENKVSVDVTLSFSNIPNNLQNMTIYAVNRTQSNFHLDWDPFATNFSICSGSPYDVSLGYVLCPEDQSDFYNWSWEHREGYQLDVVWDGSIEDIIQNSALQFSMNTGANGVYLIEFY